LRQARDSTRISDMSSLNSALNIYLADGGTFGTADSCFANSSSSATSCNASSGISMGFNASGTITTLNLIASRQVDGTGWIPVNFTTISAGAPFGILPIDPSNNFTTFYAFASGSSSTYKLNARMESVKFSKDGSGDVGSHDGGTSDTLYEVGNKLDL
jgi:hypothetical protein